MKKQTIWIIIGCAISGAILYPIQRRRRMKEKAEEERLMKEAERIAKEAKEEEERRHEQAMKEIAEKAKREQEELAKKTKADFERIGKIGNKYGFNIPMKYKDENGVIHEVDASDYTKFHEVMCMKNITLIFPTADDL